MTTTTEADGATTTDQQRWSEVGDLVEKIGEHCLRANRILDHMHGADLDVFDATQMEVLQSWLVAEMEKLAQRGCAIVNEVERENGWRPSLTERSLGLASSSDTNGAEVHQ